MIGVTRVLAEQMRAAYLRACVAEVVCGICSDGLCEDHESDCVWPFGSAYCRCENAS